MAFRILSIADVDPIAIDKLRWHPLRHTLDVRGFGLNAYSGATAGDEVVEDHTEADDGGGGHQELYVVISGRARFTLDGEALDVPAGSLVFLPDPTTRRHAVAEEPGTLVLAVGGEPGKAFEVSAWEARFRARGIFEAGERERGLEIARAGLAEHPADGSTLYDLACLEAQAAQHDAAIEHLRAAVAVRPEVSEWAKDDRDLDPLRGRADWPL